jgi:hypothetical protein
LFSTKNYPNQRTVISTETAHAFCEQRSGEIRFSIGAPPNQLIPFGLRSPQFIFRVFRPKIACQALKHPNSIKQKEIELAC